MSTVGFIGLGVMGRPMATNLLEAGHHVVVHNRSRAAVRELVGRGAEAADSPIEVGSRCSTVITCLPDSPDVEAVILGESGVLAAASDGQLLIDMSTIKPATARLVAQQAVRQGVRTLDAPVSGGQRGAIDGTLAIMVGGDAEVFAAARPLLDVLGATVVHVGSAGAGQTVKAANQLLVAGTIGLVAEALVLLEACGVDLEPAIEVLGGGLAGSAVLQNKAAAMLAREFTPGFRTDLHHKDLQITLDTAHEHGVVTPLTALVAQMFVALRNQGMGELDHSALFSLVEELSARGDAASEGAP